MSFIQANSVSDFFAANQQKFGEKGNETGFLRGLAARFGFVDITYFSLNSKWGASNPGVLLSTYAQNWKSDSYSIIYDEIDPIILKCMQSQSPVCWSFIPKQVLNANKYACEVLAFDILQQGLTVPIHGDYGEAALISIVPDLSRTDVDMNSKGNRSNITYLAGLLHNAVAEKMDQPVGVDVPRLTKREMDVLQWAAFGKTSWETGSILDLSERTVEFYHANAATKLCAATKAHAVSRAIAMGFIQGDGKR